MRRLTTALVALLLCLPAAATDKPKPPPIDPPKVVDKWSGEDKALHLLAGAAVSTAGTIKWQSRAVGFGAGCGASVAFELLAPGFRSYKDAAMGCLGTAFGALIGGWHVEGQRNGVKVKKEF